MSAPSGTLSYGGDEDRLQSLFRAPYLVRLCRADRPLDASVRNSIAEVSRVRIGRGDDDGFERSHDGREPLLDLRLADSWMSATHAELVREGEHWRLRDLGSKNGSFVNGQRCDERVLCDGDLLSVGNSFFLFRDQVERSHRDAPDDRVEAGDARPDAARTLSIPFARTMDELARVADSGVSVLLQGETGTGKEVSARYVHECSRRAGPFVAVNCGALPQTLVESELFGHRKGAFSGATSDRQGLVQSSSGGTLFLDEIGEMPLAAQVALLRVLQEHEVQPIGASRPIPVELRVVAATHASLEERVAEGRFRADLYARLCGVVVSLPSLRERREDLGILIATLLQREFGEGQLRFEREALGALLLHSWPMNIRELQQCLVGAAARAKGAPIARSHLPDSVLRSGEGLTETAGEGDEARLATELRRALADHGGNVSAVAREMGKARVQIRRWCKRYGIDPKSYRGGS